MEFLKNRNLKFSNFVVTNLKICLKNKNLPSSCLSGLKLALIEIIIYNQNHNYNHDHSRNITEYYMLRRARG